MGFHMEHFHFAGSWALVFGILCARDLGAAPAWSVLAKGRRSCSHHRPLHVLIAKCGIELSSLLEPSWLEILLMSRASPHLGWKSCSCAGHHGVALQRSWSGRRSHVECSSRFDNLPN